MSGRRLGSTAPSCSFCRKPADCNFIVYHSAYQFGQGDEITPFTAGARSGVNSLVTAMLQNELPPGSNVYGELGTTWYNLMNDTRRATHVLGKLLKYLGEDNVVWGTDSMWYSSATAHGIPELPDGSNHLRA